MKYLHLFIGNCNYRVSFSRLTFVCFLFFEIASFAQEMGTGKIVNGKREGEWIKNNNNIKVITNFVNGVREGKETFFYKNSDSINIIQHYKNNVLDGEQLSYNENGTIRSKSNFVNGKVEGEIITYYYNGQIETIVNVKNNKIGGEFIAYYPCGQIRSKGDMDNYNLKGFIISYFIDGSVYQKENYNSKSDFEILTYYINGEISSHKTCINDLEEDIYYNENGQVQEIYHYLKGEEHGEQKNYFRETGKLQSQRFFLEGYSNGEQLEYHENGQLKCKKNYVKNRLEGEQLDFDSSGVLREKSFYENKKLKELMYYYPSGNLFQKSTYQYDTLESLLLTKYVYDDNGQLIDVEIDKYFDSKQTSLLPPSVGKTINGNKEGEWVSTFPDGTVRQIENYKNGNKNGVTLAYFANGKIKLKENYKNNQLEGTRYSYFSNGILEEETNYSKGKLNGRIIRYTQEGKNRLISNFKNGEDNGKDIRFYENGNIESVTYYELGEKKRLIDYYVSGKILSDYHGDIGTEWYEDGTVSLKEKFGKTVFYSTKGDLVKKIIIKKEYTQIELYENNILLSKTIETRTEGDLKINEVFLYYQNGKVKEVQYFKNGKQTGEWLAYYDNGNLRSKKKYINGFLDCSPVEEYDENGKLKVNF